jgi:hypothetical protein
LASLSLDSLDLRREAQAGRREDFEKYLSAVPDVPAEANDRLD